MGVSNAGDGDDVAADRLASERVEGRAREYAGGVSSGRFRRAGLGVTNVVVAAARRAGVEGAEKEGVYEVEGSWSFSAAPVSVDVDGKFVDFTPSGYTLETWSNGAWGTPVAHVGTNYVHSTVGQTAPVRLIWVWRSGMGVVVIVR